MPKSKLSERQVKLVGILSALPEKQVKPTLLQKTIFLCMEQVKPCELKYSYKIGHYGPYSADLSKDLSDLRKKRIVKLNEGKLVVASQSSKKWPNATKTVLEFKRKFPDESSVVVSALTSPKVLGRPIGEAIRKSR